jgi:hypothetical protein
MNSGQPNLTLSDGSKLHFGFDCGHRAIMQVSEPDGQQAILAPTADDVAAIITYLLPLMATQHMLERQAHVGATKEAE